MEFAITLHMGSPWSEYKRCVVCLGKYLFVLEKIEKNYFGFRHHVMTVGGVKMHQIHSIRISKLKTTEIFQHHRYII